MLEAVIDRGGRMPASMRAGIGIVVALAACWLSACSDTVIYGERTGFNLAIFANESVQTPVEVNAGLKRTVATAVPATDAYESESGPDVPDGEAVSMISGFDLAYAEGTTIFGGDLTIRTRFASGMAAIDLADDPSAVAQIVEIQEVKPVAPDLQQRRERAANVVRSLNTDQQKALAGALDLAPGIDPEGVLLTRISKAETTESFEVIAQKIQILFGQEV